MKPSNHSFIHTNHNNNNGHLHLIKTNVNPHDQIINHTLKNLNNLDYGNIPNELLIQSLLSLQPTHSTNNNSISQNVMIPNMVNTANTANTNTATVNNYLLRQQQQHQQQPIVPQTNISNNIIITRFNKNITNNNITHITTTTSNNARLPQY